MEKQSTDSSMDLDEVSRQVGLSALLLKAWDLRYGIIKGERDISFEGRTYSDEDVLQIQVLLDALAEGQTAIVNLSRKLVIRKTNVKEVYPLLQEALLKLDEPAAQTLIDACVDDLPMDIFFEEVLLPILKEIGAQWQSGSLSIAQEHFASNIIRGRLLEVSRNWGEGSGPIALLSCAPGEIHEFPLIMTGILLHQRGWSIRYLGANTPAEAILEAMEIIQPHLTLLSARLSQTFETRVPQLRLLAQKTILAIAGRGATKDLAFQIRAHLIEGGPVSAANELSEFLRVGRL